MTAPSTPKMRVYSSMFDKKIKKHQLWPMLGNILWLNHNSYEKSKDHLVLSAFSPLHVCISDAFLPGALLLPQK